MTFGTTKFYDFKKRHGCFAHDYRTLIVNLFICKRIRSKVAVIIDDLKTVDPWDHSGVRIYGTADIVTRQGEYMDRLDIPITNTSEQLLIRNGDGELKNLSLLRANLM